MGINPIILYQVGPRKLKLTHEIAKVKKIMQDCDIIHTNNLWNYFSYLPYNLSKNSKKPNVISVRGSLYAWSLEQSRLLKKISWFLFQKKALDSAGFIHVTCNDELTALRELGIKNKIVVSQHGVDVPDLIDKVPDSFYDKYKLSHNKKYFLFMSRLHTKKGLDMLFNVWSRISHHYPDWELLVAGPDYGNYIPKITKLNAVKYMGMLSGEEKEYCFSIAQFFVLPSYTENFGVVIGEAMARTVPVLTSTNTPWKDVNTNNAGVCFDLSTENLKRELEFFFNLSDSTRKEMGRNARELIVRNYSWERVSYPFYDALKSL
ncbi:glycosyltransferase [Escherichia coli]|uniref:glycosyltransferase n=1 Tax=Escherichia coli TaxID=562 RepID=UPI000BE86BB2